MESWLSSIATQIVGVGPAAFWVRIGDVEWTASGGARIAVDQIGFAPIEPIEDQLRALRRERDAPRRENRLLKIAVAELERVSGRDPLTPLFNRPQFLNADHPP